MMLSSCGHVFADVLNTHPNNAQVENTVAHGTAKMWDLSPTEWNRYQALMAGEAGIYYQNLTPPEVLGYYAENDFELRHYAEVYARHEHEKIERELRFNNAFSDAAKRLYSNERPIASFDISAYTPIPKRFDSDALQLKSDDHLLLFVDINENYIEVLPQLIETIQKNSNVVLDIYLVNVKSNVSIQQWAREQNLPMDLSMTNRITLNKDDGVFSRIDVKGRLPQVLLIRAGQKQAVRIRI